MSATDELRALLDDAGVEWADDSDAHTRRTWWRVNGVTYTAVEVVDKLRVSAYYPTPAQAVEATLGATDAKPTQAESSGTCKLMRANWDDGTCTWGCICSACDAHLEHETGIGYNFCPICGAKVVDA